MGSPQLNIRLSRQAADALEAAVFVRGARSAQEIVGPVVEEMAANLARDPDVADALAVRVRHRRRAQSNITPMAKRTAGREGSGSS
jgi:Holliday junction resolvasome RuvABC endonuclease subunit